MRWRLPTPNRNEDPENGLAFDFLATLRRRTGREQHVMTGHDNGLITLTSPRATTPSGRSRRTR